jgi:hypothetical protein
MHLAFDMLVNGEHILRRPVLFYSFVYRARRRFLARAMMDLDVAPAQVSDPYRAFFTWKPGVKRERRSAKSRMLKA